MITENEEERREDNDASSSEIEIPVSQPIKQIGNYIIGAQIGSGAFGKVVLGTHILTNEPVAIKILDKLLLAETPEDLHLVNKEISILKIVKHKNIAQLYEILETPKNIYIIMEYCEGKDLMDYIILKTRLSEVEGLKIFQQLINVLEYLHNQNITHRDIKIDNMLLDSQHNLKLVDFGLSTKYTDDELLNQPCGTVVYAAPEVLEGKDYHGMLADVWSSGIVLFSMIAGYLPFCEHDDEVNKANILKGDIEIPQFFSAPLKDLLGHMLDMDPMTRYTLGEIKEHMWFNSRDYLMIPGIVIGVNSIPVDERILNMIEAFGMDKDKVRESIVNNRFDEGSAMYQLLVRKVKKQGFDSVSDLCSIEFVSFIMDEKRKKSDNEMKSENFCTIDVEEKKNLADTKATTKKTMISSTSSINRNENKEESIAVIDNSQSQYMTKKENSSIEINPFEKKIKEPKITIPKISLKKAKELNTSMSSATSQRGNKTITTKKNRYKEKILFEQRKYLHKKEVTKRLYEDTLSSLKKKKVKKSSSMSSRLGNSINDSTINKTLNTSKKRKYSTEEINKITSRLYSSKNKNKVNLTSLNISSQSEKKRTRPKIQKKSKVNYIDSSAPHYKKLPQIGIRDYSYSPKQSVLNTRTRESKLPWTYKKTGIDLHLQDHMIYKKYKINLNKNRNNLRIKKNKINISTIHYSYKNKINSSTLLNKSSISNSLHDSISKSIQSIKHYHKSSSIKHYSLLQKKPIRITSKPLNISSSFISSSRQPFNLQFYDGPIDISCILMHTSLDECVQFIVSKLKENSISYIQTSRSKFKCTKNGLSIDIELYRLKTSNRGDKLFYSRIRSTQGYINSYRQFTKILFDY